MRALSALSATSTSILQGVEVCDLALRAERTLAAVIQALSKDALDFDAESLRASMDEVSGDSAYGKLPEVFRERVAAHYDLVDALDVARKSLQAASGPGLGLDPKTGLGPDPQAIAAQRKVLLGAEAAVKWPTQALERLGLDPELGALKALNKALRLALKRMHLLDALQKYHVCVTDLKKLVQSGDWQSAQNRLTEFIAQDDAGLLDKGAAALLAAAGTGAELDKQRRGDRQSFERALRLANLDHPLLAPLKHERDELNGPEWAKLHRWLLAAERLATLAANDDPQSLTDWLSAPLIKQPEELLAAREKLAPLKLAVEKKKGIPKKHLELLLKLIGPANFSALSAGAGEITFEDDGVAHNASAGAFAWLQLNPDDADSFEVMVGHAAVLAASPGYRRKVLAKSPRSAPGEVRKDHKLGPALASALEQLAQRADHIQPKVRLLIIED